MCCRASFLCLYYAIDLRIQGYEYGILQRRHETELSFALFKELSKTPLLYIVSRVELSG